MNTNQIYGLVNSVASQALGSSAIAAVDATGLVSLGDAVLSSATNTENFVNTLCQRIGRTIYHYRAYRNKLRGIILENDMEWGAILQKIDMELPAAVNDDAYDLIDGQSIDPWIIAKPSVSQKLFVGRNPYMFKITISRKTLKEAFLSESAMGSFISFVFGKIRNMIEVSYEELARTALVSAIAETSGSTREVKLLTEFNAERGTSLTYQQAIGNSVFLNYCVGQFNLYRDYLTDMSELYNDGTTATFTPYEDQRLTVLSKFERVLQTTSQYAAFHDQYVKFENAYDSVNFWQAAQDIDSISAKKISDQTDVTLDHVVAVLHDRDAVGVYQQDEEVLTTPVNARGLYYNTFYHIMKNMFLDTSENIVVFTLN